MNQTLRVAIAKAMKEHRMFDNGDAESAILFVEDLLEAVAEDTKINEPYATKTIADMKKAKGLVYDLVESVYDREKPLYE